MEYETNYLELKQRFEYAASELGRAFDDEKLATLLNNTIQASSITKSVQSLLFTIKTHKPAGEIALRLIHSSAGHPARAISSFISQILLKKHFLKQRRKIFLLKNS